MPKIYFLNFELPIKQVVIKYHDLYVTVKIIKKTFSRLQYFRYAFDIH